MPRPRCLSGQKWHFSESPCSRLLLNIHCICLPQQIKAHGPDEFDELKSKRSKDSPKGANLVLKQQTKISKIRQKSNFGPIVRSHM